MVQHSCTSYPHFAFFGNLHSGRETKKNPEDGRKKHTKQTHIPYLKPAHKPVWRSYCELLDVCKTLPRLQFGGGEHTGKGRWAGLCKKVRNMVATNWTHQTRMSHSGDAGTLESIGKSRSRLVNPFPINLHQWVVVVVVAVLVVRVHREPPTGVPTSVYSGIYVYLLRTCLWWLWLGRMRRYFVDTGGMQMTCL